MDSREKYAEDAIAHRLTASAISVAVRTVSGRVSDRDVGEVERRFAELFRDFARAIVTNMLIVGDDRLNEGVDASGIGWTENWRERLAEDNARWLLDIFSVRSYIDAYAREICATMADVVPANEVVASALCGITNVATQVARMLVIGVDPDMLLPSAAKTLTVTAAAPVSDGAE